jgi:hypothetical protein
MENEGIAAFGRLSCGVTLDEPNRSGGELREILNSVDRQISYCGRRIIKIVKDREEESLAHEGAFLLRKLLELVFLALVSRVDPLRTITLCRVQSSGGYASGLSHKASFQWRNDVLPEKESKELTTEALKNGPARSLFKSHLCEVYLVEGLQAFADFHESRDSGWLSDLRVNESPMLWIEGELHQLYSRLSKGVHADYLRSPELQFDLETSKGLAEKCFKFGSLVASASHFAAVTHARLDRSEALRDFHLVEQMCISMRNDHGG